MNLCHTWAHRALLFSLVFWEGSLCLAGHKGTEKLPLHGHVLEALPAYQICELALSVRNPFAVDLVQILAARDAKEFHSLSLWQDLLIHEESPNKTLFEVPFDYAVLEYPLSRVSAVLLSTQSPRINRSLTKFLRKHPYRVTLNTSFEQLIRKIREIKIKTNGTTWISEPYIQSTLELHRLGYAESVEIWDGNELIAGAFGVRSGVFFRGESHFSLRPNAGKLAILALLQHLREDYGIPWIHTTQNNNPVIQMGAREIPYSDFLNALIEASNEEHPSLKVDELLQISDWTQAPQFDLLEERSPAPKSADD